MKEWEEQSAIAFRLKRPTGVKIDSDYFGKLVIAPWNIIRYNVFTSHGPDIYGTEPFSFYFINHIILPFIFPFAL